MKTLIALALTLILFGCTSPVDPVAPETDQGKTYLVRVDTESGYRVYVDGKLIANYSTARDLKVTLSPGTHYVLVSTAEYARRPISIRVLDEDGVVRVIEDSRGRDDLSVTVYVPA